MAKTSCPQRTVIDPFWLPYHEEADSTEMEKVSKGIDDFSALSQLGNKLKRRVLMDQESSKMATKTPENQKLSPAVPNAPMKQQKRKIKAELRRKKLEYTEPEDENEQDWSHFSVQSSNQCQSSLKLVYCDKENDYSVAYRGQTKQAHTSINNKQSRASNKPQTKLASSKNRTSKLEGDFSHIRI